MARKQRVVAAAFLDGDLVVGAGDAGELDARAVLVGPEVRRLDDGALVAARRASRVATAIAGRSSAPVQCSTRCGAPVEGSCHAAQSPTATTFGIAVWPLAPQSDAVAEFQSAALEPLDVRDAADADDDDVGGQVTPIGQVDPGDALGIGRSQRRCSPVRPATPTPQIEAGAVGGVGAGDDCAEPGAELDRPAGSAPPRRR